VVQHGDLGAGGLRPSSQKLLHGRQGFLVLRGQLDPHDLPRQDHVPVVADFVIGK